MRLATAFAAMMAVLTLSLALVAPAAAQDGYRICSGDTLHVEVLEDPSLNRDVLVSPDGRVSLPLAGSVKASGQTIEGVQSALAAKLAPNFAAAPNVYVSVAQLAERVARTGPAAPVLIDIYVLGEVAAPGRLQVPRGTTVLQLFAETKGFTQFAATKRIQLRRTTNGVEKVYPLNYVAIEKGSSRNGTTVLINGDVIVVPQRRLFE